MKKNIFMPSRLVFKEPEALASSNDQIYDKGLVRKGLKALRDKVESDRLSDEDYFRGSGENAKERYVLYSIAKNWLKKDVERNASLDDLRKIFTDEEVGEKIGLRFDGASNTWELSNAGFGNNQGTRMRYFLDVFGLRSRSDDANEGWGWRDMDKPAREFIGRLLHQYEKGEKAEDKMALAFSHSKAWYANYFLLKEFGHYVDPTWDEEALRRQIMQDHGHQFNPPLKPRARHDNAIHERDDTLRKYEEEYDRLRIGKAFDK